MPVGGPIGDIAAYPNGFLAGYQAGTWKASLMPVRTNWTAIAAKIKPMTRVKMRIPVSFSRRATAVALRSTTYAISTLRAMASSSRTNEGTTFGAFAAWPGSAITVEIEPGPLSKVMDRKTGTLPTASSVTKRDTNAVTKNVSSGSISGQAPWPY